MSLLLTNINACVIVGAPGGTTLGFMDGSKSQVIVDEVEFDLIMILYLQASIRSL